jgi:glycerophosphoryl diester phosphodiesterase
MSHSNSGAILALDRIVAIAHRGGSRLRPENTLAAFDHAMTLGVDGLECDVHVSRDGDVVVIHDATLDRTTDATGPVSARSADELRQVDAGFRFGEAEGFPYRGRQIFVPTLKELLERHASVPVIVEMKGDDVELARRTVAVVRQAKADGRVILAGFSQVVLDEARRLAPDVPTSASSEEARTAIGRARFYLPVPVTPARVFQVPFRLKGKDVFGRSFVDRAARRGLPVHAWIVDDPRDMTRLLEIGVTGLISDRPDLAVSLTRDVRAVVPGMMPSDARLT